jgi:hypothetical protein
MSGAVKMNTNLNTVKTVLSPCQEKAYERLNTFVVHDTAPRIINLVGSAGSGKTHLLAVWATSGQMQLNEFAFLAPTHRAKEVLVRGLPREAIAHTTDSFLGMRHYVNPSTLESEYRQMGEWKFNATGKSWYFKADKEGILSNLKGVRVVIQDEASMLSTTGKGNLLLQTCAEHNILLVLVGDTYQLPPVDGSPLFPVTEHMGIPVDIVSLKTQMRTNLLDIQTLFNDLRKAIDNNGRTFNIIPSAHVRPISRKSLQKMNKDTTRILAHTNKAVNEHNSIAIAASRPSGIVHDEFVEGDFVLLGSPAKLHIDNNPKDNNPKDKDNNPKDTESRLNTGYEFKIAKIGEHIYEVAATTDRVALKVVCRKLYIDNERFVICAKRTHDSYSKLLNYLVTLKQIIRTSKDAGKVRALITVYSELKEIDGQVQHSFSQTVYKSQGSTYPEVVVDVNDIHDYGGNTKWKLMYVACSRASHCVWLIV